ncbi:MAG: HNH endonuclease, partial [Anaerolineales bacterium]|nr:HNH endonuclease [Anaerolineales bacterium]
SPTTAKRYYYAGGQRIAERVGDSALYFLLGDHLGSTSITANSGGALVAEVRYAPWGETRYLTGTTPTTFRYTGQRQESGLGGANGLYDYGARWLDPYINRWLQPDSIVPEPGNPQALNRYSYSLSNPLKYTDPSGHTAIGFLQQFLAGIAFQWSVSNREAILPSSPGQYQAVEALSVDSDAFIAGRVVGGLAAAAQGILEFNAGAGAISGGVVACGTGVLCPAGAGAVAGGAVVAAHGASVAIQGAAAAGQQANILFSKGRGGSASGPYPTIIDPRTGQPIAAPPQGLTRVDPADRVSWTMDDRAAFIRQWHENGYAEPAGGWAEYDIHHIIPREFGGSNDFDNLVPVLRNDHQQLLNPWWNSYQ